MERKPKKNRIISISGETNEEKLEKIAILKEKLLEKGYKEENIHIQEETLNGEFSRLGIKIDEEEHQNEVWVLNQKSELKEIPEALHVKLITRKEKIKNEKDYDLIINTEFTKKEDIADTILSCLDCHSAGKFFVRRWASPKFFLPMQGFGETIEDLELMKESMSKNGIFPNRFVEIGEVDDKLFIFDGHHKTFGAALAGRTLVPYVVIAKDNEISYYGNGTVRQRVENLDLNIVKSHEGLIDKEFHYTDVYPEIYEYIKEANEMQNKRRMSQIADKKLEEKEDDDFER